MTIDKHFATENWDEESDEDSYVAESKSNGNHRNDEKGSGRAHIYSGEVKADDGWLDENFDD